jgi:hypothetical protein
MVLELHNLTTSPSIIRVIKSRRMRWVGNVGSMGEMRNVYKTLAVNLKKRGHLEYLGVDGRIILEWVLGKQDGEMWTGSIHGIEPF